MIPSYQMVRNGTIIMICLFRWWNKKMESFWGFILINKKQSYAAVTPSRRAVPIRTT